MHLEFLIKEMNSHSTQKETRREQYKEIETITMLELWKEVTKDNEMNNKTEEINSSPIIRFDNSYHT